MKIPRSTQLKALQLESMPPTYHFTIEQERVTQWGEAWIRVSVSHINARNNIYLQCHKNKDGSLTIWHNPDTKEQSKTVTFDKLVWLRKQMDEYRERRLSDPNPNSNAFLNEMLAIQDQIDEILEKLRYSEGEPRKRRGNAIHQPLNVILEFYSITQDIWDLLPPRVRVRKKIQAEVAIKNQRKALERLTE
jgi:hypothetical protein